MNFGIATHQNLSEEVVSQGTYSERAQTLTTSEGILVINGVRKTSTEVVAVNDLVELVVVSADTENTPKIIVVESTATTQKWCFVVVTKGAAPSPKQRNFGMLAEVDRGILYTTTPILIERLSGPIPAKLSPVMGAQLFKNGISVGTSTTVENGDVLHATLVTPLEKNRVIELPLACGNMVTVLKTKTDNPASGPTPFYLNPTDVMDLDQPAVSNTVTLTNFGFDPTLMASCEGGELLINGLAYTQPTLVTPGNTLAVRLPANSLTVTQITHVKVRVGDYVTYWSVCARPSYKAKIEYANKQPYAYPASNKNPVLVKLTGTTITETAISGSGTGTIEPGQQHVTLLDPNNDKIHVVNAVTNTLAKTVSLAAGSKPDSIDVYPKSESEDQYIYVGCSGTNTLHKLKGDTYTGTTLSVGEVTSVCVGNDGRLRVAKYAENKVDTYSLSGALQHSRSLANPRIVKAGPEGVFTACGEEGSLGGSIWRQSYIVDNQYEQILTNVCVNDFYVVVEATKYTMVVADGRENALYVLNGADLSNQKTVTKKLLDYIPISVFITSGAVLVADEKGRIHKYSRALDFLSTVAGTAMVYGICSVDNGTTVFGAGSLRDLDYSTLYDVLETATNLPESQIFPEVRGGSDVFSEETTLMTSSGRDVRLSIAPDVLAYAFKNDVEQLEQLLVKSGDTIRYSFIANIHPLFGRRVHLVGFGSVSSVTAVTAPDRVPAYMYFEDVVGVLLADSVMTGALPVMGMSPGVSATLEIDKTAYPNISLYVNGELVEESIDVVNGDLVQLYVSELGGLYGDVSLFKVNHQYYGDSIAIGEWKVQSLLLDGAIPWPLFATNTQGAVFDHSVTRHFAGASTLFDALPGPHSVATSDGFSAKHVVEPAYHSNMRSGEEAIHSSGLADGPWGNTVLARPLAEVDYSTSLRATFKCYEGEGAANPFKQTLPNAIVEGLESSWLPQANLKMGKQAEGQFRPFQWKETDLSAWSRGGSLSGGYALTLPTYVSRSFSLPYTVAAMYTWRMKHKLAEVSQVYAYEWFDRRNVINQAFEYQTFDHEEAVDQVFRYQTFDHEVEVGQSFDLQHFDHEEAVEQFFGWQQLWSDEVALNTAEHKQQAVQVVDSALGSFLPNTAHEGAACDGAFNSNTCWTVDRGGWDVSFASVHEQQSVTPLFNETPARVVNLPQYTLVVDTVVYDLTPPSCIIHGLFNTDAEIILDAVYQGFEPERVEVVTYKGCKTWIVAPFKENIECYSSEGRWAAAWAVYQTIVPLEVGNNKNAWYVGGG